MKGRVARQASRCGVVAAAALLLSGCAAVKPALQTTSKLLTGPVRTGIKAAIEIEKQSEKIVIDGIANTIAAVTP